MAIVASDRMKGKAISIVGLSKNAGKTTTLNAILKEIGSHIKKVGLTSIGRDGEQADVVFGHMKPRIEVMRGTIIATAAGIIDKCNISKRIIESTGFPSALGDVYILECLSSGYVQISGPSMTAQLLELKEQLFEIGCETILIDGAIGRRSLGSSSIADGIVLCTSANVSPNIDEVVEETSFIIRLYELPIWKGGEAYLYHGALSEESIKRIIQERAKIKHKVLVIEGPDKVVCTRAQYQMLSHYFDIQVKRKAELLAISVNPTSVYGWSFDGADFVDRLKETTRIPVIDVVGEN